MNKSSHQVERASESSPRGERKVLLPLHPLYIPIYPRDVYRERCERAIKPMNLEVLSLSLSLPLGQKRKRARARAAHCVKMACHHGNARWKPERKRERELLGGLYTVGFKTSQREMHFRFASAHHTHVHIYTYCAWPGVSYYGIDTPICTCVCVRTCVPNRSVDHNEIP